MHICQKISATGSFKIVSLHISTDLILFKDHAVYISFIFHSLTNNPLLQNFSHLMAIESITGFSHHDMHNVVSFSGNAEFKSERPKGVLKSSELKAFIEPFPNSLVRPEFSRHFSDSENTVVHTH